VTAGAVAVGALLVGTVVSAPASAYWRRPPLSYALTGDPGGSTFEGIGTDQRSGVFYVSEVSGGEIHRGTLDKPATAEWLAGDGTDGRYTAVGVTVDAEGRIYIAGGSNSSDHPGEPDLWVYSSTGQLLAALRTGVEGAFLNDVAIGPDGSAYVTDSTTPRVFKVSEGTTGWSMSLWKDASADIAVAGGFNLNGIVATPDRRALLAVQSNTGQLWRFDLRTRAVAEVAVTRADLTTGDGLIIRGREVTAVRNFAHQLTTVRFDQSWTRATLVSETATPADKVLTTAKILRGRLLAVDSKFDESPATPPYEVIVLPVPR